VTEKRMPRSWVHALVSVFAILITMTLLPTSSAKVSIELNDDEFTNQETLMWTVRGEPYQNCTVLFGNNKWNAPYFHEKITLNVTGVHIGYIDLTEYRDYDVTHWISVQNESSSAFITYILRYSDAQRIAQEEKFMAAMWSLLMAILTTST